MVDQEIRYKKNPVADAVNAQNRISSEAAGADLRRGLLKDMVAPRGDLPAPGQEAPAGTRVPPPPAAPQTTGRPDTSLLPKTAVLPQSDAPTTKASATPLPSDASAAHAQHAENLDVSKQFARGLDVLRQGGATVAKPLPHVQTAQAVLPKVLAQVQPRTAGKLPGPQTAVPRPQTQIGDKVVVAEADQPPVDADRPEDPRTKVAGPFVAQPTEARVADRDTKLKKIGTNAETAEALRGMELGIQEVVVAASGNQEFSGGSHQGQFGDTELQFKEMVGRPGSVLQVQVYGESQDYPETNALYATLGLSRLHYGTEELKERVATDIGRRMSNTSEMAQSQRVDAAFVEDSLAQVALGERYWQYGKGVRG